MTPGPGPWAARTDGRRYLSSDCQITSSVGVYLLLPAFYESPANSARLTGRWPLPSKPMRPLVRLVFYHFGGDFKAFQHATPFGLRWSARSGFAFALAEALFHGAFDLAVCRLFGDLTALVVLTLAACDGELELDDAVLGVELEWDEGLTLLLALADEAVDLLPVQQQLAVAGGELSFLSGIRVRRDVRPDQEDFAVPHPGIALLEVGPALPDGLYLGPRQLDASFIGLLDGKVVDGLLVSREVCHNRFTTLSSARCMSGRTSSNSTRTLSPTL